MIAATEDDIDEHVAPFVLNGIKEKLEVTDSINQLDIADGLKELLLSSSFTFKSLLNATVSHLAKTLGIDEAKLVSDAINKDKKVKIITMIAL